MTKQARQLIRKQMRALKAQGGNPTDLATCAETYEIALRVKHTN